MTSRILIISTNNESAPQPTVPIGAAWVAESLSLAGFEVQFLDLCFQRDPLKTIGEKLKSFSPSGIGLSVRNLDNCDFLSPRSFLPEVKVLVEFIKARSNARILLGGAGVSIMPLQVLEYLDLDYAVVGEGERAAVAFFENTGKGRAGHVPGVVCRTGCNEYGGGHAPQFSDNFVVPRMHAWVDTGRYLRLEPVLPVQGKRGCANRCLYCTYRGIEGGSWRLRDAAAVVEEIGSSMRHTGAREFEFVDSVFNEPEGYLETLLEEILRSGLKARFSVSSLSPKGLTRDQVKLMERAGMTSLVVTPESASDVTLAALRKEFTERDVYHAAELLSGSSIRALWCFLVGGPREDAATLAGTINFMNRGMARKDSAFITTGVRIYPGTGLRDLAIGEGMLAAEDDLLMPAFYFSRDLTPHQAMEALQKGVSPASRCIFLSETRANSLGPLRRLGTMLGLPTPFWRYAGFARGVTGKGRQRILC